MGHKKFFLDFSRREFLQAGLSAGAGLLLPTGIIGAHAAEELPTLSYRLLRDDDLLNVEVRFINFGNVGQRLLPLGEGQSSIAVIFPPQNLAEAIFDERHDDLDFENDPIAGLDDKDIEHFPPVRTFISGPSWVVFEVPDHAEYFDLSRPESWWKRLEELPLRVAPGATGPWTPRMPTSSETALEIPFRLYISPGPDTRFAASRLPDPVIAAPGKPDAEQPKQAAAISARYSAVTTKRSPPVITKAGRNAGGRAVTKGGYAADNEKPAAPGNKPGPQSPPSGKPVELWNASLTSRTAVTPSGLPPGTTNIPEELAPPKRVVLQARALYSPDYQRRSEPRFSLYYPAERPLSLHALTRHRLVKQMSEGDGLIDIEHLILTALGADANFYYASRKTVDQIIEEQVNSKGDPGTELRMWKHRIVVGRDVFFVEAFFGFLFPFCHPSIYVELTQRKFVSYTEETRKEGEPKNNYDKDRVSAPGAYLLKRRFILVQDPLKNFTSSDSPVGRMMPTKRVTLRTVRSPDLASPVIDPVPEEQGGAPKAGTTGIFFWPRLESNNAVATWEVEVEDESGQVSITTDAKLWFASNIKRGHWGYREKTAAERTIPFPGTKIAFAPEKGPSKEVSKSIQSTIDDLRKGVVANVETAKKGLIEEIRKFEDKCEAQTDKIADKAKQIGKELDDVVKNAAGNVQGFIDTLDTYRKKLDQLNELGATLETKAITFASNFVRHEMEVAKRVVATLDKIGTIDEVDAKIVEALKDVKGAFKDLDNAARGRIREGIEAIRDASKALRVQANANDRIGIDASAAEKLKEFKNHAEDYLRQYGEFEQAASNLGSAVFHTGMEAAKVVLPAVKGLLPDVPEREIQLVGDYITGKFGDIDRQLKGAQNGVYAALTEAIGKAEDIGGQIRNGLAKPSMVISGISRELGAVASDTLDKAKEIARKDLNKFQHDLSEAIPDAKLFGVIPLRKIVAPILRGHMPDINVIELPEKIERNWVWSGPVKEQNFGILTFLPRKDPVGLYISSNTTIDIPKPKELAEGKKPTAVIALRAFLGHMKSAEPGKPANTPDDGGGSPGEQKDRVFAINLLDLVEVEIAELSVSTKYTVGQAIPKPVVKPILARKPVEFLGPLAFLGALQNGLSFGSLNIAIDPEFVSARSNTTLPPISFGAFSCRNLALKSGVALPLSDRPLRYDFAFSSFNKPFELSVMGFAGRGYFGAAFESNGRRDLEGALEFGGALAFDVGVASGGLYVMAGGYLKINNSTTELAGYLRAGGQLDVLGLIHVSVEFFLALAYRNGDGESVLYGYCEITVSIDLTLYSFDVHIGMEKVISGSKKENASQQIAFINAKMPAPLAPLMIAAAQKFPKHPSQQAVPLYFFRDSMDKKPDKNVTGRFHKGSWKKEYWSHFDFVGT